MSTREFEPLADALRAEVLAFCAERGAPLTGPAGAATLETNSGYVERRGRPLVELLRVHGGVASLTGLEVADIGCGFGALSVYFASLGARVLGIDVNAARLEVGRAVSSRHALDAEFRAASMEALPVDDAAIDVAVMNNSLCYLVEPFARRLALAEARRVLRPGGWLVIRNPNRWAPLDPFTSLPLLGALPGDLPAKVARALRRPRSRVLLVSPGRARRELEQSGFAEVMHAAAPGRDRPRPVEWIARYQHLLGRRPR